jgi:hypothetical protein
MTKLVLGACVFALGIAVAGLATAASTKDTYRVTAKLTARAEVPRPKGVPAGAAGLLTGTVVEQSNDKARLSWRLTYSKLSGKAIAAHIHAGRPGKAGAILVALCGPCRNGQRGTAAMTHAQVRIVERGAAYVNIHTPKNAAGEIRGQVKVAGTSGSMTSTGSTDDTTTTTNTNPYP